MPEPFRSFASIFAERDLPPARERLSAVDFERTFAVAVEPAAPPAAAPVPSAPPLCDERIVDLLDTFVAELARLRARVAEHFEERAEAMLADLARKVLARELATAPVAIEALLAGALGELEADARVVIRVSNSDAKRMHGRYAVVADEALGPGDFAVDVDDGRYDASLQTRLDALLASHRVPL